MDRDKILSNNGCFCVNWLTGMLFGVHLTKWSIFAIMCVGRKSSLLFSPHRFCLWRVRKEMLFEKDKAKLMGCRFAIESG